MSNPMVEFIGWDKSALELVGEKLLELAEAEPEAFRRATIVVPTAESGRRLKEWMADTKGKPLLMPRMVLAGQLIQTKRQNVASKAEMLIAWIEVLTEKAPHEAWPNLFKQPVPQRHLQTWALGTAERLMQLDEQLEQYELSVGELHRRLESGEGMQGDFQNRWNAVRDEELERWESLKDLFTRVENRLKQWGLESGRTARLHETESLAMEKGGAIIVACLPELSPQVRSYLQRVETASPGRVRIWVNAHKEESKGFDSMGCVQLKHWLHEHLPAKLSDKCITMAPSAQGLARAARAEAAGMQQEKVVLAVCDASFTPALVTEFARGGWKVHMPEGRSAQTTDLAALPHLLAEASKGALRVNTLAPLLRNVAMQHIWQGGKIQQYRFGRLLDGLQQRYYPERAEQLLRLLDTEKPLPGLQRSPDRAQEAADEERRTTEYEVRELEALRSRASYRYAVWVAEFVALCRENVVEGLLRLSEGLRASYGGHALQVVAQHMAETSARVAALLKAHPSAEKCAWLMLQRFMETETPALEESSRERTQLDALGWRELAYAVGEKIILAGLHEGCVPESPAADPFLPDSLRQLLGLPCVASREARDVFLLTALLKREDVKVQVLLSRLSADGSGAPVAPSTLLYHCPDNVLADRVKDKLFDEKNRQPEEPESYVEWTLDGGQAAQAADEPESVALIAPGWTNVFQSPEHHFSPSEINAFLACPLRFWMKYALGIVPWDEYKGDDKVEMAPSEYGTLMHGVLEDVSLHFTKRETYQAPDEVLAYAHERLAARCVERFGEQRNLPTLMRQVRHIRDGLERFVTWHCGELEAGWECVGCELKVPDWEFSLPDGSTAKLSMRADRIDHKPGTNEWRIIDYKTHGDKPCKKHLESIPQKKVELFRKLMGEEWPELWNGCKYWKDVQLPLYAAWLEECENGALPKVAYFNLPRAGHDNEGYNEMSELTEDALESARSWAGSAILKMRQGLCLYSAETFGLSAPGASHDTDESDPRLYFANLKPVK